MKLGKTSWSIITVGIIIVAFASLGAARSQQIREHSELDEKLSVAETRLNQFQLKQLSHQQEALGKQLEQTTSQLEAAEAILSQPRGSIVISDALFQIAEACGVEVIEITSSGPSGGDLEGTPCYVLPLTTRVEGDVPDLIYFVTRLNGDLVTGVVESAEITLPGTSANTSADVKPSANIRLVVYTYEGD